VRPSGHQAACRLVRNVVQLLDGLLDRLASLLAHLRRAVDHPRHGAAADACTCGDGLKGRPVVRPYPRVGWPTVHDSHSSLDCPGRPAPARSCRPARSPRPPGLSPVSVTHLVGAWTPPCLMTEEYHLALLFGMRSSVSKST